MLKNRFILSIGRYLKGFSNQADVFGDSTFGNEGDKVFMAWDSITKVKRIDRSSALILNAGWASKMAVFCYPEEYSVVVDFINEQRANEQRAAIDPKLSVYCEIKEDLGQGSCEDL